MGHEGHGGFHAEEHAEEAEGPAAEAVGPAEGAIFANESGEGGEEHAGGHPVEFCEEAEAEERVGAAAEAGAVADDGEEVGVGPPAAEHEESAHRKHINSHHTITIKSPVSFCKAVDEGCEEKEADKAQGGVSGKSTEVNEGGALEEEAERNEGGERFIL